MAQQRRRPNTMVYGNLAYDLDTLASQRQLEEAARPERQSQPQQAPRHRTAARPRQRVSPLALCAVGALTAMAVVRVMGYIQLTAVTGSISDMQEQVSQLEDQRVSLVMDYERTFDIAKIKEAAEAAGMDAARIVRAATVSDVLGEMDTYLEPGDAVLVKASRFMGLERVVEGLVN